MSVLGSLVHGAGQWYVRKICHLSSGTRAFTVLNERSIEYRFALQVLGESHPRTVLEWERAQLRGLTCFGIVDTSSLQLTTFTIIGRKAW